MPRFKTTAFWKRLDFKKAAEKVASFARYCTTGVWEDPRATVGVRLVKTANLAARSFMDRGLQIRSMSLTYRTVLAIVPAFALLVAIGRGFGMQDLLESTIYGYFPSQTKAISTALSFVDSYLKEASQGLFVGLGIVFLLWTVISLLSAIEDAFNNIWDVKRDRNFYQKLTDYIAFCLMIPILIICSSGVSIFMATTVQDKVHLPFLTPLLDKALEAIPFLLVWVAFTLSFWLIPNVKVKFKYAAISGAICALCFQVLQMLFFTGQIYVSKYNAIYGSFAFLPLLLIWLQLSWLILLSGCVLTYSLQNIFTFDFLGDIGTVSAEYLHKLQTVVMAVVVRDFIAGKTPPTISDISTGYDIPIRLANRISRHLQEAGLVYQVVVGNERKAQTLGLTPAVDAGTLTVAELFRRLDSTGESNFVPRFRKLYGSTMTKLDAILENAYPGADDLYLKDIELPAPQTA